MEQYSLGRYGPLTAATRVSAVSAFPGPGRVTAHQVSVINRKIGIDATRLRGSSHRMDTSSKALASLLSRGTPTARTDNTQAKVGDTVAIHSRGKNRWALVIGGGPKKITCVYTTQGSIDEAQRSAELSASRNPESDARDWAKQAGKNWDFNVAELVPATRRYLRPEDTRQRAAYEAAALFTRAQTVEATYLRQLDIATRSRDLGRKHIQENDWTRFGHVTTVSVSRTE